VIDRSIEARRCCDPRALEGQAAHANLFAMTEAGVRWPQKRRELHNHHFDSTIWNDFKFRDDDIVIATYGKAGTTWVQQIVSQLLFNGAEGLEIPVMSPWLDLRVPPKEVNLRALEAQSHRRFLKTHLPVDALVFSPRAKYIYVGRDGRDVIWSMYNHHANANEHWYRALNDTPGRVGPPIGKPPTDIRQYYREWLDGDGYPFWPFFANVKSWWEIRELPNVMLLHFRPLEARPRGGDPARRLFPRYRDRRGALPGNPRALQLRLHEAERGQGGASRRCPLGGRRRDLHPHGREWPLGRCVKRRGKRKL
jgi:Sulfotransferase domain